MQSAYWLWVTNGRGLADSVRAVGIDESAEPWARAGAAQPPDGQARPRARNLPTRHGN